MTRRAGWRVAAALTAVASAAVAIAHHSKEASSAAAPLASRGLASEREWLVDEVVRDLAEMCAFSGAGSDADQVVLAGGTLLAPGATGSTTRGRPSTMITVPEAVAAVFGSRRSAYTRGEVVAKVRAVFVDDPLGGRLATLVVSRAIVEAAVETAAQLGSAANARFAPRDRRGDLAHVPAAVAGHLGGVAHRITR